MSSDSNEQKPDSTSIPPSGVAYRTSARAPSAWGAVRDALAAVHNLVALLRSPSVQSRIILDLMPELKVGAGLLHAACEEAVGGDEATAQVGAHGVKTVDALDSLLAAIAATPTPSSVDREAHANRAADLADELEGAADLLALLDRAAAPVATEVVLDLVAREAGRMSGTARGREMLVQFAGISPDCVVTTDPYILGPILSLLVASVHASGVNAIVLRARSSPRAHFLVEPARLEDAALPTLSLRVTRWIPPSEAALRRIAEQIGASLEIEGRRGSIVLP
jgi:hypothetical protein